MNKFFRLFVVAAVLSVSVWQYAGAFGQVPDDTYNITEVTASSGTVGPSKGGVYVKGVYFSTGTNMFTDYFVLLDTTPVAAITSYSQFATANKKTPAIWFPVATSSSPITSGATYGFDFGNDVFFSTSCYVYKTNAASGEALKVFIKWRK